MEIIKFYRVDDEFGNFSNFAPYSIFINCEVWATVEHYFQASKFYSFEIRDKIKALKSGIKAAKEGRKPKNLLRSDWEQVKDGIMRQALFAKFLQHHNLKIELLKTGDAHIIEHTANDNYWGDGGNGNGRNRLGELLMEVRNEIKLITDDYDLVLPPWIAYPDIDQSDMFWRMGLGESYLDLWFNFYLKLSDKKTYKSIFPEPNSWNEFYD